MVQTNSGIARYRSDFEAAEALSTGAGAAWHDDLRRAAFERFEDLGFPTARRGNENWKYTNVRPIARSAFERPDVPGNVTAADLGKLVPHDPAWTVLAFVDGFFSPELSSNGANGNGVRAGCLAEAAASDAELVRGHLAKSADVNSDGFIALNTAFASDGAYVHVPDGVTLDAPVHLVFHSTEREAPAVTHPRTLVIGGQGSRLTVIESYVSESGSAYFTNAATEVSLSAGAAMRHYRYVVEGEKAFHVGVTRVHQLDDSEFTSTALETGAGLLRNDVHVALDAPGSACYLNGLYMTQRSQFVDNHINVDHIKPHGTSDQYFKGILGGRSRAVYSGRVVVHRGAQKSNAQQKDLNLLLSRGAEVDTKPSLEIYADDVTCGHGATAGAVAEDALFYMRSRGIDLPTARALLIRGFASEIIDSIDVEPLREFVDGVFVGAIPSIEFND